MNNFICAFWGAKILSCFRWDQICPVTQYEINDHDLRKIGKQMGYVTNRYAKL